MAIDITTPTPSNDDAVYKSAYDAVAKAKASGLQADIDAGRQAVSALKGTAGEFGIGEFSKQLDAPQQALNTQTSATPAVDPTQQAIQDYLKKFTDSASATALAQQKARDAVIQANLAGQVADEQNNINTENTNFTKNVTQTRNDIYNAQENNRAQGVQRGIQYSQQQQAIEGGTSLAGEKMIQQAQADRDTRIANIKNKIQALKTGANLELQSSQATADAQVSQAQQTALQTATQRQWQVDDSNTAYQRELNLKGVDKQTQIDLFNMDEASKEKFFKMDEASKEKFFNMDTDRQKMFFDLNEASKEKFWKLDAQQQEKMFNMNADLQKQMFSLSSAQQVKMLGLEAENQKALAVMNYSNQKSIMDYSATLDQKALDAKVKATADQAKAQTFSNYLMSDPSFKAYPSVKEMAKDPTTISKLSQWMDTQGISKEEQYNMIGGQMTANTWDRLMHYDTKAVDNLKSILGIK